MKRGFKEFVSFILSVLIINMCSVKTGKDEVSDFVEEVNNISESESISEVVEEEYINKDICSSNEISIDCQDTDVCLIANGSACVTHDECEGGLCITTDIYPAFVGGYCSAFCDPLVEDSCTEGSACFNVEIYPPVCAKKCISDCQCRLPDYICEGLCLPQSLINKPKFLEILTGDEPEIKAVLSAVDDERMMKRVNILAGKEQWNSKIIHSRAVKHPDHELAVSFIIEEITLLGLEVFEIKFENNGINYTNLQTDILGLNPDLPPVIIMAHYDSIASQTQGWIEEKDDAPGAVDNGSGVVVALEIASILTAKETPVPQRTLRILLTDSEENGLLGSKEFVTQLKSANESIACALNVDMIGGVHEAMAGYFWYQFSKDSMNFASLGLESIADFIPLALPVPTDLMVGGSDSVPFWENDLCSVTMAAWPRLLSNHTINDLPSEYQKEFYKIVSRSAIAVISAWVFFEVN